MVNEVQSISRMFKDITDKIGKVGKQGYSSAVSSIGASQRMGKATVLKMEISSRRTKMEKLFARLGERIFNLDTSKSIDIRQDVHMQELIDALGLYNNEVKEIESHVASLKNSDNGKNLSQNRIREADDIRTVENALMERGNTKSIFSGKRFAENLSIVNIDSETSESDTMTEITKDLKSTDKQIRLNALKQLFKYEGPEATPHLLDALKDKESEIRRRAASYLGWKMTVSAAPSIMITASKDKAPSVRKASIEALGELGTKEAVPTLIEALDSRDIELRRTAYKSLTKITNTYIEFKAEDSLSLRFKSIQRWEKWWRSQEAKKA